MLYEPVDYIVEYVVCAALFLIIVMARYFAVRRFPNQKNRVFALILWAALLNLITDVLSSLVIDNIFLVPLAVTYVINTTYYSLQFVLLLLMTGFAMAMSEYLSKEKLRRMLPLMLPGLVLIVALLCNPFMRWFFYVDPERGYVRGPLFFSVYVMCLFYLLVTLHVALRSRKKLSRLEFSNLCTFLALVLVTAVIQFLFPRLLITGVAIAASVVLMYFTIQNPESLLDTATGAFTYEAMFRFLQDCFSARDAVMLVAVKISNMPRVNDLLGVNRGSELLRRVNLMLNGGSRDVWVFRMRGSCFAAVTRSQEEYSALCERVQAYIGTPWRMDDIEIELQATVCCADIAKLVTHPLEPEDTVNYLESILLQKPRFGEPVRSISVGAELLDAIQRRKAVEAALREAINTGNGLDICFQPLYNVKRNDYDSAEVLLRFYHPSMGSIPPDEFVPIAETCGLITRLDELVVRKTCAFIQEQNGLRDIGFRALAVNLSALEFMLRRLPDMLQGILKEYGVDPSLLYFEVTETAATESFDMLHDCMTELCGKGYRFALDDFGTGYANIARVIQLPFSMVKLDRSLLLAPGTLLEDLSRMFARLGHLIVIEGVESAEQDAAARGVHVDSIQGFYYSKELSRDKFVTFAQNRSALRREAQPAEQARGADSGQIFIKF